MISRPNLSGGSTFSPIDILDDESDGPLENVPASSGVEILDYSSPPASNLLPKISSVSPVKSPQEIVRDLQGLDEVVEDIAVRFWDCRR